ncbi:MAG: isoleucine--tRNA ligase [Planctomycetes bacterium]|nr:isoleucine--tRNA ligase [Planctomycetota bacterium]
MAFEPVAGSVSFPKLEEHIGRFWLDRDIYRKSLAKDSPRGPFIFFEGPPTANGMPHPGHCLTRAIKDLFPRYRTMRGYRCERKAGWDTHGLPVEVEVCKGLGIHSKEEIEAYGVERFIQLCQKSVWRYMQEWERLTRRIGFWVDLDAAYVTYHQSYIESVWWSLKELFDRGLLYQGHKIVWWWAQGGTALSSGEVGQGYREVADPSVYVRFPIVADERAKQLGLDGNTSLLVWTTTPWTLPSNQFAAVNPRIFYALIEELDGRKTIVASSQDIISDLANKAKISNPHVVKQFRGEELIGLRYAPPFDCYYAKLGSATGRFRDDVAGVRTRELFYSNFYYLCGDKEVQLADLMAASSDYVGWRVIPGEFVTTDTGTGIVHVAPAFGEVDYDALQRQKALFESPDTPPLICCVGPDGKFTDEAPEYVRGRWVKECDRDITRDLKARGLLLHQEQYLHEYPFCWRAEEDALIQYPRRSWFIKTSEFKDAMLANNARINWLPEHIRDGRFGNFLATNVDWALSRERYWGTPLPIWVCDQTGKMESVASYEELLKKPGARGADVWEAAKKTNPELPDDLRVHKPYIDQITYDSPFAKGARMQRVTEVIDCWYDSGAMPFAQWGYRGERADAAAKKFNSQFPADFISEAIDQTRGWFYSQLAISTLLFGEHQQSVQNRDYPHPFKNCIVLGLMLAEWWESKDGKQVFLTEEDAQHACGTGGFAQKVGKMSKSKRNYREPSEIFDRYGADALRWYFYANQPPWTSIRYVEQAIKDSVPEFLLRLWNVYSFFVIYADIDGFDPAAELKGPVGDLGPEVLARGKSYRPVSQRGELDRWIISELHRTTSDVIERMDAYDNYAACQRITALVDALSNWYVRRSRDRFWSSNKRDRDKLDAYWTLYECLLTTAKLVAPFVPFLAETLWQNLAGAGTGGKSGGATESVHLAAFPEPQTELIDRRLSSEMEVVREIVSLGRSARTAAKLKVRQPLDKVEIVLADPAHAEWLAGHTSLVREELNVKQVEFAANADQYVTYTVLPDLKRLGPRLGKQLPQLKQALGTADAAKLLAEMQSNGHVKFALPGGEVTLDAADLQVRLQAKSGWAAAQGASAVVVLATELTPELVVEGWARELIHAIQSVRKDMNCNYTDRIEVSIVGATGDVAQAIKDFGKTICSETLGAALHELPVSGVEAVSVSLAGHDLKLFVKVVGS